LVCGGRDFSCSFGTGSKPVREAGVGVIFAVPKLRAVYSIAVSGLPYGGAETCTVRMSGEIVSVIIILRSVTADNNILTSQRDRERLLYPRFTPLLLPRYVDCILRRIFVVYGFIVELGVANRHFLRNL
jgi:hypothetical protein